MTNSFGNKGKNTATNYNSQHFTEGAKIFGTASLAIVSVGVVLTGIWLLLTDKASLTVVGAGVFAYSAILVIIGKFWKQG